MSDFVPQSNIPYGKQEITPEDLAAVATVLQSEFLTQGPSVLEFEKNFAAYIGCSYAVAVANGTAALHLCALALNVQEGSTVLTTPITFAASANCIKYCGGTVEFVDIDPATGLMDLIKLEEILKNAPKGKYTGVVPVDFAGYPVDLEKVRTLANTYGLWIIEDACHAPGGYFTDSKGKAQHCGNGAFAELAIFSFHPVKHIATGEGGMITTNDKALYEKLLLLRTHGITRNPQELKAQHGGWYYEMQTLGYNYRLSDMQAALGISQLKRAASNIEKRRAIAARYDAAFASVTGVKLIRPKAGEGHAYHLYVVQVQDRKGLYDFLREKKIMAQVHYIPVHTMPYYKEQNPTNRPLPASEAYYAGCLSLPMYPNLSEQEQAYVIQQVKDFVGK